MSGSMSGLGPEAGEADRWLPISLFCQLFARPPAGRPKRSLDLHKQLPFGQMPALEPSISLPPARLVCLGHRWLFAFRGVVVVAESEKKLAMEIKWVGGRK